MFQSSGENNKYFQIILLLLNSVINLRKVALTFISLLIGALLGAILSPIITDWYNENYGKTPQHLAALLKSGNIQEFNNLRKEINQKIEFDGIDLSGKKAHRS